MTIDEIFKYKSIDVSLLEPFGFKKTEKGYIYEKNLSQDGFIMTVFVSFDGKTAAKITDKEFNDEYTLHLSDEAVGGFVGQIRKEYEHTLSLIAESCAKTEIFKWKQTKEIINYVAKKYQTPFEHLWEKFPENAVWRRPDNKKWFGIVMTVSLEKLGFLNRGAGEVINLRIDRNKTRSFVDKVNFFPAYHMNKNTWYTIVLDYSVPSNTVYSLIDQSYELALGIPKK